MMSSTASCRNVDRFTVLVLAIVGFIATSALSLRSSVRCGLVDFHLLENSNLKRGISVRNRQSKNTPTGLNASPSEESSEPNKANDDFVVPEIREKNMTMMGDPDNENGGGRVAICVTGQPRTLNLSITDPSFPPTWGGMNRVKQAPADGGKVADSIQQRLFAILAEQGFDVFMHVTTVEHSEAQHQKDRVRYPRPGDSVTCEPLRPQNASNRLFCYVQLESSLQPALPQTFRKYIYRSDVGHAQLLHQLWDQLQCMRQIEAHGGSDTYSHIIRLRPDFQVMAPLPPLHTLDFGARSKPKILYNSKQHCCCGNEDTFGIGTYEAMQVYLSRYNTLQSMPTETIEAMMDPTKRFWTSEIFLEGEVARVANATMEGHEGINGCTLQLANRSTTGVE